MQSEYTQAADKYRVIWSSEAALQVGFLAAHVHEKGCDWPGKSDGGSASAVLPGSSRELDRHPLVEFPINFQAQYVIQKGALVAYRGVPRQRLERFPHGSSVLEAHSFSRDGWSSFTGHQNPS